LHAPGALAPARNIATIQKDHPAIQGLASLPPEVMMAGHHQARSQHALESLSGADYAEFTGLVHNQHDPVAKGFLYKALAAGNSVADIKWLAGEMAGKDRGWLIDNLTLGDPRGVGGGVKQQWSMSCNASTTITLRGNYDPVFALRLRLRNMQVGEVNDHDPNALNMNQADLERDMLETSYQGGHPQSPQGHRGAATPRDSQGTGRYADDLLNAQSGATGMTFKSVENPSGTDVVSILNRSLTSGMQVPLVVGDNFAAQAHYVLVQGRRVSGSEVEFNIHDPASGQSSWVKASDIANGTIPGTFHKVGTIEVPSAAAAHSQGQAQSAGDASAGSGTAHQAPGAKPHSAVGETHEQFLANREPHVRDLETRIGGETGQIARETAELVLDSEWQVEAGLRVADPLFGEQASFALKSAGKSQTEPAASATLNQLSKLSRGLQKRMLDVLRDTSLDVPSRRHELETVISEWERTLTRNRSLFPESANFEHAFRFEEARAAVRSSVNETFSKKLVLDEHGNLHRAQKPAGSFRQLIDHVVKTNKALVDAGEQHEFVISVSDTPNGKREVLLLARVRREKADVATASPVEVQSHPDPSAVIVDVGSGESSFALDLVQPADRTGGPIVQTEYGPKAFDASRTRRDLTWENAVPHTSIDSVVVFGDPLQSMDILFGSQGVKRVFINNVNADYSPAQYTSLARVLFKCMAKGGRVEIQHTDAPEHEGGMRGDRKHIKASGLATALSNEAANFGRTFQTMEAPAIKDYPYSVEPSRRRDGVDSSASVPASPVPEERWIITFD
jgi:hypothetical protein